MFAFLAAFLAVSGILDWRTLHFGIANSYGFGLYGEAGKALLIGIIVFILLVRRSQNTFKLKSWELGALGWLLGTAAMTIVSWVAISEFGAARSRMGWLLIAHVSLIVAVLLLLFFAFGARNIYTLVTYTYRREVLMALGLSVCFELCLLGLYMLWPVLSSVILSSVRVLFDNIGIQAVFIQPYTLIFSKFSVTVGEYCSGIDSAALFTGLYAIIGVLDWPRINHKKYLAVLIPALLVLFSFNILRVFLLILAGYYISPQIAFSLFHTYAGMVFFMVYSAVFWGVGFKWMLMDEVQR